MQIEHNQIITVELQAIDSVITAIDDFYNMVLEIEPVFHHAGHIEIVFDDKNLSHSRNLLLLGKSKESDRINDTINHKFDLKIIRSATMRHIPTVIFLTTVFVFSAPALSGEIDDLELSGNKRIAEVNRKLIASPRNANLYVARARLYAQMCMDDRSIEDCTAALRLDSKNVEAYKLRASMYASNGRQKEALKDLDRLLEIRPNDTGVMVDRAIAYDSCNKPAQALADLDRALKAEPTKTTALNARASIYSRLGQHEKAIADYTTRLKAEPGLDTYNLRARAYLKLGRYREALSDYTYLVEHSVDPEPLLVRGDLKMKLADYRGASADYSKALERDTDYASTVQALLRRAEAYEKLGKVGLAGKDRAKARALSGRRRQ